MNSIATMQRVRQNLQITHDNDDFSPFRATCSCHNLSRRCAFGSARSLAWNIKVHNYILTYINVCKCLHSFRIQYFKLNISLKNWVTLCVGILLNGHLLCIHTQICMYCIFHIYLFIYCFSKDNADTSDYRAQMVNCKDCEMQ